MGGDGDSALDLFGQAVIFVRPRGRGRPAHVPSIENHNKILLLAATGHGEEDCAAAIGVSVPTLRKHYFSAVKQFAAARLIVRGEVLQRLAAEAADGNVAAMKELGKLLDRAAMPGGGARQAKGKAPKKGKKEEALDAARNMGAGDDSKWGFLPSITH